MCRPKGEAEAKARGKTGKSDWIFLVSTHSMLQIFFRS
jgi:hypothetical protein